MLAVQASALQLTHLLPLCCPACTSPRLFPYTWPKVQVKPSLYLQLVHDPLVSTQHKCNSPPLAGQLHAPQLHRMTHPLTHPQPPKPSPRPAACPQPG